MSSDRDVRENRSRFLACVLAAQIFGALAAPALAQESHAQELRPVEGSFRAYAGTGAEARVSEFSGLPVPRYSSLKFDKVNGRSGPSADYPVEWTYERSGLPVVIVRESQDWRKIRDPQGDEVWVKKSQLAAERTAVTTVAGAIRRQPDDHAGVVANYASGAVLTLGECAKAWCRVEADGLKGFARRDVLWGAADLPSTR